MNQKDIELEKALDDLFGDASSDSIKDDLNENYEVINEMDDNILIGNIDNVQNEEITNINIDNKTMGNIENDTIIFPGIELITSSESEDNIDEVQSSKNNEETDKIIFSNQEKENNDEISNLKDDNYDENIENKEEQEEVSSSENNLDIKKIIIYFIIGILLGFVLIFFLLSRDEKQEVGISNCSFVSEDDNYKISDQYKITYVDGIISYVEGTYLYTAKTKEYENQVEFIKKEKLPAIINSNGMSGFTYVPETASNYFKVQTYLDYDAFDINTIKNINQDTTPLSFFTIDVNKKYEDLRNNLEKKGFKCTLNK